MSYTIADADHVDFSDVADRDAPMLAPVHPGVVLRTEFLEPLAMSHYRLAKSIGVSARRIGEIVAGQRAITADTALRLQAIFDLRAEFWLGLQARYDLAMTKPAMTAVLDRINPWASQKENRPSV